MIYKVENREKMNIIPNDEKLIGKTIVYAEIGGYGIKLKFSDGSILDYSSSSGGYSCWEIIDDINQDVPCDFCSNYGLEDGDTLYISADWDGGVAFDYVRDIHYCPKCGRKLTTQSQ